MRVAIGGISQESNTFSSTPTDLAAFRVERGEDILAQWAQTFHEVGGFIEGASRFGYELVPTLVATALPSGRVTADAFEVMTHELILRLTSGPALDGVLLALHGAMVSEEYPDGDGEIVRRVRHVMGRDLPIVITHDHHANVSDQVVRESSALIIYKTNPHLDQRDRGLQAAKIIAGMVRGEVRPVQALSKPPMMLNILHQNTDAEPMKSIMQAVRDLEQDPRVLAASIAAGYQYADVYEMGPCAVVVTNGDLELAQRSAQQLSDQLWNVRDQLVVNLPGVAVAVRQAKESPSTPVVLVDIGDNIGGGSTGDGTTILSELLSQAVEGWVVVIADPDAAQACMQAGIGATISLRVGGKCDRLHGEPVQVTGRVKCLHDGKYREDEPRHGGARYNDQGLTAVLEIPGSGPDTSSMLVLTTRPEAPFSLHQLLSLGIQPQRQPILVVKAAIAYRAAYEPIARRIIEVDTPGLTAANPSRFTYRNVRRPLWGLKLRRTERSERVF